MTEDTFIDPIKDMLDGEGFRWRGVQLEPFTLRRQALFMALKQKLPDIELRRAHDYLAEACLILFLCSSSREKITASMRSDLLGEMWDWAEENVKKQERIDAIKVALEIWDDANSEAVVGKSEGGEPGKPEEKPDTTQGGTEAS